MTVGERTADYFLNLLAQVGGGRGPVEHDLVRFGLGVILWAVLLVFALRRRRDPRQLPRERLLAWGFAAGLGREAFMFVVTSLEVSGLVAHDRLEPFFPPLEHALAMAAVMTVTGAFLLHAVGGRRTRWFLPAGVGSSLVLFLVTALPWGHLSAGSPALRFGQTWFDWAFHVTAALLLLFAIAEFGRLLRGWMRTVLLLAAGCFFLDDFLMLFNLATAGAHAAVFAPPRHVLHLAGVAVLGYVYLRELADERARAVTHLQTVLNLAEAERLRAEAIFDAVGDAVSVQGRDYRVIYQNRVHRDAFGNHFGELCHVAYAGSGEVCVGCPVALSFADGEIHRVERHRGAGEGFRFFEVTASCLRDAGGAVVAGIEVARDITARAETEAQLRRAKADLERQNTELRTLDSMKDGLIRDVTHEFKTPVAKHAMQIEILRRLLREHGLERETSRVLGVMESSIQRQQKMIRDILDLARLEAGGRRYTYEPVRLDELVGEVVEDRAYAIEAHGVALRLGVPAISLTSDREMLHCLLSNLVDNAIKYRSPRREPTLAITARAEGGESVLCVTDNGIGFAAGEHERAFERFWQASASAEGSGVGLTICRMIVEDLGGAIALDSPGRDLGTTVTVRLPREPNAAERPVRPARAAAPPPPG